MTTRIVSWAFIPLCGAGIWTPSRTQALAPLDPAVEQITLNAFYQCDGVNIETTPPCQESVLMDADGTHVMPFQAGAWSRDGTRMLVVRGWSQNNVDIYVVAATGGTSTNLTNHPAYDWWPAWSPDGSRIAFAAIATSCSISTS
jgi:hypothetical protein